MPFGDYEDMDDCISKNPDKDNPGAYCATIHHEITGKWPAEEAVRKRISKEYQKQLREGFSWLGEIDIESYGAPQSNIVKVVALHPITTYHPGQWPEVRHYVEPELQKVAESFRGGYVSLDHYWIYDIPYEVLESKWDPKDRQIEMLCFVPDEIVEKIRDGRINAVSVDMDWELLRNMDGVVPEGLKGLGVSFLEKLTPGDPQTSVELLNSLSQLWINQGKTWKGKPETVKLKEGLVAPPLQKGDTVNRMAENLTTKEECESAGGKWENGKCVMPTQEAKIRFQDGANHGCGEDEVWDAEAEKCVPKAAAVEETLKKWYTLKAATIVRNGLKEGTIKFQDVLPEPTTPPTTPPPAPPEEEHPKCVVGTVWDDEQQKCVPPPGAVTPTAPTPEPSPSVGEMVEASKHIKEMRSPEEIKADLAKVAGERERLYSLVDALWPQEEALKAELEAVIQAEVGAAVAQPVTVVEEYRWLIDEAMTTIIGEQEEEGPFQCPYCDADPFETRENLEAHIKAEHPETIQEYWSRSYRKPKITKFIEKEAARRLKDFLETRLTPAQKTAREVLEQRRIIADLNQKLLSLERFQLSSPHYKENYDKLNREFGEAKRKLHAKEVQLQAITSKLGEYAEVVKNSDAISRQATLELLAPTFPLKMGGVRKVKSTVSKGHFMSVPGLAAHTILRNRLEQIRRQIKQLPSVLG